MFHKHAFLALAGIFKYRSKIYIFIPLNGLIEYFLLGSYFIITPLLPS